jgi:hypothetical protein
VALSPTVTITVPVAAAGGVEGLNAGETGVLTPTKSPTHTVWFRLPLTAPLETGTYTETLEPTAGGELAGPGVVMTYTVRPAPDTRPAGDLILINPVFVSPANLSWLKSAPRLCWSEAPLAGQAPFEYRAMVVGAAAADSGWIGATCWQTPPLPAGTYFWKVFMRDARGVMNRTNDRPLTFVVR